MGQMTILAGPERRRRWSEEERLRIVAEALAPGTSVADSRAPTFAVVNLRQSQSTIDSDFRCLGNNPCVRGRAGFYYRNNKYFNKEQLL